MGVEDIGNSNDPIVRKVVGARERMPQMDDGQEQPLGHPVQNMRPNLEDRNVEMQLLRKNNVGGILE